MGRRGRDGARSGRWAATSPAPRRGGGRRAHASERRATLGKGAEEGGGGAAEFDLVGGGAENGSEGVDDGLAVELVLVGAVGRDVRGDFGAGEPAEEGEEVGAAGFGGEFGEVFVAREVAGKEGVILGDKVREKRS